MTQQQIPQAVANPVTTPSGAVTCGIKNQAHKLPFGTLAGAMNVTSQRLATAENTSKLKQIKWIFQRSEVK